MISSRRNFTHWFLLTAIVLSPAYTATSTLGQELEEIIVTARQRAESLQDVPASIQVFSASKIADSGIQRPSDFINLTPGVTIVDAAEVGDTQVNIRGINGARDAENSFALIIDGILMTNPASLNREYTNLQQIEILKGPQGALYGRNAAAGAIIITTQKPGEETGGTLTVGGAEDAFAPGRDHIAGLVQNDHGVSATVVGVDSVLAVHAHAYDVVPLPPVR